MQLKSFRLLSKVDHVHCFLILPETSDEGDDEVTIIEETNSSKAEPTLENLGEEDMEMEEEDEEEEPQSLENGGSNSADIAHSENDKNDGGGDEEEV